MRRWFHRLRFRPSLFWSYLLRLMAVLILPLLLLLSVMPQFAQAYSDSRLQQIETNFEKNCEIFSQDIFKPYALPTLIESTDDFISLGSTSTPLDLQHVLYFSKTRNFFSLACAMQGLPAESFLYFRNSGVCITRTRMFSELESFFSSYLSFDDPAQIPDLTPTQKLPRLQMLPECWISINGRPSAPYLPLLVHNAAYGTVYGFLYPEKDILDVFQLDSLPDGAVLRFTASDGTQLVAHNSEDDTEEYIWLTQEIGALSCQVLLGVPGSYVQLGAQEVRRTVGSALILCTAAGAALCLLFSFLNVRPLRRLIRAHTAGQPAQVRPGNELAVIDGLLTDARQSRDSLRGMLLSNLLVRASAGLPISENEYSRTLAAFPMFQQPLRAAVICDRSSDHAIDDSQSMVSLLRSLLPREFFCEYINLQESILFIPDGEEARDALLALLRQLNGDQAALRFAAGISDPFVGLNLAGAAIRQAQACVPLGDALLLGQPQSDAGEAASFHFDPKQFQQALSNWDQNQVLTQIDQLAAYVRTSDTTPPEELFYRILFLLRDAARADKLSFQEYEKITYQHSRSPAANIHRLRAAADNLFQQRTAIQISDRQLRCAEIVDYIRQHFSDATLCMASLSKQFHASERFVYNSVLEATGMNVSTFMAQIRMEEAARLLRETDDSVGVIAEKCGYPVESTFYRNFKKYYHVTPAEYKSSLR